MFHEEIVGKAKGKFASTHN